MTFPKNLQPQRSQKVESLPDFAAFLSLNLKT